MDRLNDRSRCFLFAVLCMFFLGSSILMPFQVRADYSDPGAVLRCNQEAQFFSVKSVMDTSSDAPGTVRAEPGYVSVSLQPIDKCELHMASIRARFEVDPPRASGTCAGFTHTWIRSMHVNGKSIAENPIPTSFNSACFSDPELYDIQIKASGERTSVTLCYATWDWKVGYTQTSCVDKSYDASPCFRAGNSAAMRACAVKNFKTAEAEMKAQYKKSASLTPNDYHKPLADMQRSWIKMRDQGCKEEAQDAANEPIWPVEYFGCLQRTTEEHTHTLAAIEPQP